MSAPIPDLPDDWENAGLFYRATNGWEFINLAIPPEDVITTFNDVELEARLPLRELHGVFLKTEVADEHGVLRSKYRAKRNGLRMGVTITGLNKVNG